jgi:signal transduction histidine kinase
MENVKRFFRDLVRTVGFPEMRVFWLALPVFAGLIALSAFGAGVPAAARVPMVILFSLAALASVFWSAYRLAAASSGSRLEHGELKSIVQSIGDALIVYNQDFRVLFFNPSAEKLFSLKADDVLGKEVSPQLAEDPAYRFLARVIFPSLAPSLVYRSRAGQYPQIVDISFDDPLLELRVTTSPIVDAAGNVIGFMKVIANRTQEISLLKSKNEFIEVVSHQLRTPITEVNWALDTVVKDEKLAPDTRELLNQTAVSAKRIMNIVENLLDITKMEEGRFGYNLAQTNLVQFLDGVLAAAMPQVERAGLKLYFERPQEELPLVTIDAQKISMVVANLVDNAVRYNVPNGQVIVKAERAKDSRYLQVGVRDTGIGIPAEDIDKVFTKFFRAGNAVKFHTDGSGLGLWIARNIVRAHGGDMWAESELNRGTTFNFLLPVEQSLTPTNDGANAPLA